MKKLHRFAILAVITAALASRVSAANIVFNETIDLNQWVSSGYYLYGTNQVIISDGDTVTLNYTFANSQALKLTNSNGSSTVYSPAWPWLEALTNYGSFNILNASASLTNASFTGGSGATSYSAASQSSSAAHLGLYSFFNLDPLTSVQFTGVSSTFTVDYLPGGTNNYVSWFTNWGLVNNVQFEVVAANVPDSGATAVLLGLGLAGLVGLRRRFQS